MSKETRTVNVLATVCLIIAAVAIRLQIMTVPEGIFWAVVALVLATLAKS